jgi:acyl transferase domain-containing protein
LGVDAAALRNPSFVKAGSLIPNVDLFDARFFGYSPKEAEILDPQHRIFLECAWEALENSGYDPNKFAGLIGVYAGMSLSTYLLYNLLAASSYLISEDSFQVMLGNDKDFISTRVSYELNLKGPSIDVQTGCSTSLVAVHLAAQSLISYQCDMALAGGVSIQVPQRTGYFYQEGGISSPDGHCRAFDAKAEGTIFGSGVGIVVLKRLGDALADNDSIQAIIKGSAINNDGSSKIGYTAPSVEGQSQVISMAQLIAGIEAETITYVETHGTGTALGDPVEVRALTKAFQASTDKRQFCGIGSVKSNIGHLDAAAGVASLIKTTLSLKHKLIPPSLHFNSPNPKIDFENSPFYVNAQLAGWDSPHSPRRAGVSSFGIGGTNAHVILEEAPEPAASAPSREWQLLVLSARTDSALDNATANLATHLKQNAEVNLADVAYTLQVGRKAFAHRRAAVCQSPEDAVSVLESADPQRLITGFEDGSDRQVVFMFPGGGAQYVGMGAGLYHSEAVFGREVDVCCEILRPWLGYDLRRMIYPDQDLYEQTSQRFNQTSVALPALFTIEYALAKLWMSWGVRPQVMIGHSMGEYTAACLAGIFSLEDALWLVLNRGKLFEELDRGAMLSVNMTEQEATEMMSEELSIAAINSARQCVVSGSKAAIEEYARQLEKSGKEYRRIHIEVAAHSQMVEPILDRFEEIVAGMKKAEPAIEIISNVTGTWLTEEEARSARYWRRQLRETVRFGEGIEELMKEWGRVMVEVGPGQTLSTLVKLGGERGRGEVVINTMRHPYDRQEDEAYLAQALGKVWMSGVGVDWEGYYKQERRKRVELPTYPFERQRYWIEAGEGSRSTAGKLEERKGKNKEISEWFYIESWKRSLAEGKKKEEEAEEGLWLVMDEEGGIGEELVRRMREGGKEVERVRRGARYEEEEGEGYRLRESEREDYVKMLRRLEERGKKVRHIVHLWGMEEGEESKREEERFKDEQKRASYSVLCVAQGMMKAKAIERVKMSVVTRGAIEVESTDEVRAEKATVLGTSKVIEQESGNIEVRVIDIGVRESREKAIEEIEREIEGGGAGIVAYRGGRRSVQEYERVKLEQEERRLRERGVYVIVGGLGGVGMIIGEYLAKEVKARMVLVGRRGLPEREEWGRYEEEEGGEESRERRLIKRIRRMEEAGGEVIVKRGDVSNEEEMREVIEETYKRYGELNGVLYAAGVTSGSSLFNQVTDIGPNDFEVQYQPKVYGVYVMERVLRGRDIDFCLLFSSNASVLGGLGFVTYSAANSFLDAFARSQSKKGKVPWISASWDPWPEETKKYTGIQTSMDRYTMTVEESTEAFRRVVTMIPSGHVVVATGDLQARLDVWVKRKLGEDPQAGSSSSSYSRPNLQNAYLAPRNETEQTVVTMWQNVLGIEKVGINDNFFDLGGHSLLATRIVAQLRDTFHVDLPLRRLFETPTAAGLARSIAELQAEHTDHPDQELLEMLSGLSDDEAEMEIKKIAGSGD